MTIEILIYDGVNELDVVGPFEVLSALAPRLVTLEPVPTVRSSHGLVLTPDGTLSDAPGVLVVPGGGWVARDPGASCYGEYLRGAMPEAIAARHARGTVVAGVCTGGMLLAKAGILDGRPAVTHGPPWTRWAATASTSGPGRAGSTTATSSPPAGSPAGSTSPSTCSSA